MGDRLDLKDRFLTDNIVCLSQVYKRTLSMQAVQVDGSFNHKLGLSWDEQVNRPGMDYGRWLHGVGDLELIHPNLHRGRSSRQDAQRNPDNHRNIQRFLVAQEGIEVA